MVRFVLAAVWLSAAVARADQCAAVAPEVAASAAALLKPGLRYLEQCEPCGQSAPGPVRVIREVSVSNFDAQLKELLLDGREVDLAYLFLETQPGSRRFLNVARLTRCPAEGVSSQVAPPASFVERLIGRWSLRYALRESTCEPESPDLRLSDAWTFGRDGAAKLALTSATGRAVSLEPHQELLEVSIAFDEPALARLRLELKGDRLEGTRQDRVDRAQPCARTFEVTGTRQPSEAKPGSGKKSSAGPRP